MVFTDLDKATGLTALNTFLADKSYIEGFAASQADAAVFAAVAAAPDAKFEHAARWYKHIASYDASTLPGDKAKAAALVVVSAAAPAKAAAAAAAAPADEDDIDLFGDEEEEDEETKKIKEARVAEYQAKKGNKPVLIAKSSILLDIKPWDDETDMVEIERLVRTIEMDGLVWGQAKLIPIGYGIKKLQINCVVEDDKVGTDILEEKITEFEDHVQSVDVAAFNKI
ncbi:translation elongation factor eEF-1 beta chain [Capsaspora owczarzaki ATCC 30864]|uniref:Translation elongation factor eEF-1 beta chain n=1 Tax=Capsaspora owczarzaki (strain ATCC 30864) TaxID=595528 RepID=A0A0D2VSW4_CAPO3|nr:translation elongation factor eEF-1 beta chain [Capsaspora owczarzaki ATCC 30864]KJE94262.1 translation elongation factor eEF-1 beta chain [Capsaspora owczarzaki ATCC 30864]|eukprot:XP_004347682.1 translation elongation factor eEF-1 beta chain [Capsaspora owczarzaki ATCC 30864]